MSYGAHQYRRSEGSAFSPRETEAAAFSFVNRLLVQETDRDARMRGLVKNQQLWSLLLKDVGSSSNGLPSVLKSDLVMLGMWVMRHSIAAMGDDRRPLAPLVQVNEDMIAALRPASVSAPPVATPGVMALAG